MITINKGTVRDILSMALIVLIGIYIAKMYYDSVNKSEDPRVVRAKHLYKKYNRYVKENRLKQIIPVLDSIKDIYSGVQHYSNSFELGVIYTDKAAFFLSMALHKTDLTCQELSLGSLSKDSLFSIAEDLLMKAIDIYNSWTEETGSLNKTEIKQKILPDFQPSDFNNEASDIDRYIEKAVNDILISQQETPRRLSVCYSNLGIIRRHQERYDDAIQLVK